VKTALALRREAIPPSLHFREPNPEIDFESSPFFVNAELRQWPREGGQASLSEECRNDRVRKETLRLFREVGHRGFGYLEMKWDARTGRHRILEANVGRPTGRSAAAEAGGVEFLATAYLDALGHQPPRNRRQRFGNTRWIHLRHDLQAAFDLRRRGAWSVDEWRD
jgi:predicted ATP-grasp superfamily ATP-dependent carboligase